MKSREGTVVDADEIIDEMKSRASNISDELGKIQDFTLNEKDQLNKMIGMGALKYFILKVDSKKRILFNPDESIDLMEIQGLLSNILMLGSISFEEGR